MHADLTQRRQNLHVFHEILLVVDVLSTLHALAGFQHVDEAAPARSRYISESSRESLPKTSDVFVFGQCRTIASLGWQRLSAGLEQLPQTLNRGTDRLLHFIEFRKVRFWSSADVAVAGGRGTGHAGTVLNCQYDVCTFT
jgi:hypothetical protein